MEKQKLVWFGVFVGSTVGGFIPTLWGDSFMSMSSVIFTAIGGFLGIWLGWKIGE